MQLRKIFLLLSFFAATPVFLIFSIVYFSYLTFQQDPANTNNNLFSPGQHPVSYAALPGTDITFQAYAEESDGRVAKLEQFFQHYDSPLKGYGQNIVDAADKYHIDYRTLPAIAMQESGGCRKIISGSYNCWGWGIYAKHVTYFSDYPTAIEAVSKGLAKNYVSKGLTTPQQIMAVYNPTSEANGGSWAAGVNYFLRQLQ